MGSEMRAEIGPGGHLEALKLCSGSLLALGGLLEGSLRFLGFHFGVPFWITFWAQAGQEPFPTFLFFGSRSFQELSKRLSRGFLRAFASKMRFGTDLGPVWDMILEPPDP